MTSAVASVFITYNGLLDPLGQSQILPYIERLHSTWSAAIVSFERHDRLADQAAVEAMEARLARAGIEWICLRYHKWPSLLASTWDLLSGRRAVERLIARGTVRVIHARGYLPATMALPFARRIPLLFDIRGLQPEEYLDGGIWKPGSLKLWLARSAERRLFRRSAAAVVLTNAITPYVRERFLQERQELPPIEVIPCCVDLERFAPESDTRERVRSEHHVAPETVVFIYAGSLGTWYLPEEMARFVARFRSRTGRSVHLLWAVNNDEPLAVSASTRAGLRQEEFSIVRLPPERVPAYLSAADVSLALIRPSFSKKSSSPTKYAESLAMGLPLVVCGEVGDSANLVEQGLAAGVPFPVDESAIEQGCERLTELLQKPREFFRQGAVTLFDIETVAMPRYARLYDALTASRNTRS